ncbi:MAG: amidohydrolase family protein [Opitutus sp.]
MRIDSHQHYWRTNRGDYHWMSPAVQPLCRDFLPPHLVPHLRKHRIDKTVLVQAAQTLAETDYLLTVAADEPTTAGVVGWLDLDSDHFPELFARYRRNPKFIGLRPMLQDLADDRWILRDRVQAHVALVAEADFPFEFLTFTRHLPHVRTTLERHPGLRSAIDHLSKPPIKSGQLQPWKTLMGRIAHEHPTVRCKISGLVTEADWNKWTVEDLRPCIEYAWTVFGANRVMFGSDWPVCTLAASYDQVIGAVEQVLGPNLDTSSSAAFFGGNAAQFYKLPA